MQEIQEIIVNNKIFEVYKTEREIREAIKVVADKINLEYASKSANDLPIFIIVLSGAFVFAADLLRQINFLPEIYFVKISSYHGMESAELKVPLPLSVNIKDREVIVLEDILDTGKTLNYFISDLEKQNPKSIKTAVFLHKKEMTKYDVKVDYLCFEIPNKFVLGYGLDYDEVGRNLKDLYALKI